MTLRINDNSWLVWQLLDSAFPAGGFAHSGGLEAAWQSGEVKGREGLASYIRTSLAQAGRGGLVFVGAACESPSEVPGLDRMCDAMLTNPVANRASRAQGMAFLSTAERIYRKEELRALREQVRIEGLAGHFAPLFGATVGLLGISRPAAASLYVFLTLRGLVSAGVRLGIVGPLEGQGIQHLMAEEAQRVVERFGEADVEEATQVAPMIDLLQANQDRLYSRLFQS
jgi:urease accessory protein